MIMYLVILNYNLTLPFGVGAETSIIFLMTLAFPPNPGSAWSCFVKGGSCSNFTNTGTHPLQNSPFILVGATAR